jgi:hypothetical protein
MARNFIDQEESAPRLGYNDGFRFGFGFFVANLLGVTVLAALGLLVAYLTHQLH